jgi:hypothetical protein
MTHGFGCQFFIEEEKEVVLMNKKYLILFCAFALTWCQASYADAIYTILYDIKDLLRVQKNMLNFQSSILNSQLDIDSLMKQVNGSVTGHSGWGTYQTHDYQSYGNSARSWSSVMQLAQSGGGSGDLGQAMNTVASQFPINQEQFNKGISDPTSQKYYALQSQTVLATRSASQLDYDKIQDQVIYQQMLQKQIEKANDLKSAVDLNNRIQVESNLINLEILRQSALANQQHAISEQANINGALLHAKFLTK